MTITCPFSISPRLERGQHVLFGVEHLGRSREPRAFLAGNLRHRSTRREVALENADVAARLERRTQRVNDLLISGKFRDIGKILGERVAGDGEAATVEQTFVQQILHDRGNPPDRV